MLRTHRWYIYNSLIILASTIQFIFQIAATSGAHAHGTPESVPTAEEAKPEDEFQFIRDAAKRDNVELLVSEQQ
jgi:hypothetical protein